MSDADRFRRIQKTRERAAQRRHLLPVGDPGAVSALLASATDAGDERRVAAIGRLEADLLPAEERAPQAVLRDLAREVRAAGLDGWLLDCRRNVIDAVVRPFRIGALVARLDRVGGNILTLHNAQRALGEDEEVRRGYANKEKLREFAKRSRQPYERSDYGFTPKQREQVRIHSDQDAYTGAPLGERTDIDHVISGKEIHEDPALNFYTDQATKQQLAVSDENLVATSSSINRSKGADPLNAWMDRKNKEGSTYAESYGIDRQRAEAVDRRARERRDDLVRPHQRRYYSVEIFKTGAAEATKMGLQQAVGLLLVELIVAMVDESRLALAERGRIDRTSMEALKGALHRIGERIIARWRESVVAFRDGAVSGFLSNLLTTLVNTFLTTSRRIVRLIREGVFSVYRAIHLLACPPEGMTARQASHEASKLLATALVTSASVCAEEGLTHLIVTTIPVLAPVAGVIAAVIVGMGAGLGTALVAYGLDEADLFGVRFDAEDRLIEDALRARLEASTTLIEEDLVALGALEISFR